MGQMKLSCRYCGRVLPVYPYRAGGPKPFPAELLAKLPTADNEAPKFGADGDNAFCSKRCGHRWAVRHLSALSPSAVRHLYAYLDPGKPHLIHSLGACCEGLTISSNYRSHLWGHWSTSDNNVNGRKATAFIWLPTYGPVNEPSPRLAQATLCDALIREEWQPDNLHSCMWRFVWNPSVKVKIDMAKPWVSGQTIDAVIVREEP